MFSENTEELAQNKLVLLYLIKTSPNNLSNTEITEFVLDKNYMNYFLIQQYLSELINSRLIQIAHGDLGESYEILEKGEVALRYFEDRIPEKIKEEVFKEFQELERKEKLGSQVVFDSYPKENNLYVVNLKLVENEETLFSLYLDVATKQQADLIGKVWRKNPDFIYQNIIDLLTSEKEIP